MPFITQGKTNWKFLLIVVVLAVIVGGGALYYLLSKQESGTTKILVPEPDPLSECYKIQNKDDKIACYNKLALLKGDPLICDKIEYKEEEYNKTEEEYLREKEYLYYQYSKDNCYKQIAVAKENLLICNKINNLINRDSCYAEVAMAKEDPSICDKIQETESRDIKDNCYRQIALAKEDLSICDKIEYYQDEKDNCYKEIAIVKQDTSICNKIERQKVKDSCYKEIAVRKEDLLICGKIEDINEKKFCYQYFFEGKEDLLICDKIDYQYSKDDCYRKTAIVKEDLLICDKIKDLSKRASCYSDIAITKNDPLICDKISEEYYFKPSCYTQIALAKEDPLICNKIKNKEERKFCYQRFLEGKENLVMCDSMRDQNEKDNCYRWVAVLEEDLSICDKIESQNTRNNCREETATAGRPIWDEVSQEDCWDIIYGEVFGAKDGHKGILNYDRPDLIRPIKFLDARYKGSKYYFQVNGQTKIIFEDKSIILEKSGIRKALRGSTYIEWEDLPIYNSQNSIKLWEYFKEDDCTHFFVLSTSDPNIFLINGYKWTTGGGSRQDNYYFYLDLEKEEIILPVVLTYSLGGVSVGFPERWSIYIDINDKSTIDVNIDCSPLSFGIENPSRDASMDVYFNDETIYTDSLENMSCAGLKTFFNGVNQNFSGFYFTIAETDEDSAFKKIQYFFDLSEMKIKRLE